MNFTVLLLQLYLEECNLHGGKHFYLISLAAKTMREEYISDQQTCCKMINNISSSLQNQASRFIYDIQNNFISTSIQKCELCQEFRQGVERGKD